MKYADLSSSEIELLQKLEREFSLQTKKNINLLAAENN